MKEKTILGFLCTDMVSFCPSFGVVSMPNTNQDRIPTSLQPFPKQPARSHSLRAGVASIASAETGARSRNADAKSRSVLQYTES